MYKLNKGLVPGYKGAYEGDYYQQGYRRKAGEPVITFEEYQRIWKANARGVDLNHNYDCGFFEYKKCFGSSLALAYDVTKR